MHFNQQTFIEKKELVSYLRGLLLNTLEAIYTKGGVTICVFQKLQLSSQLLILYSITLINSYKSTWKSHTITIININLNVSLYRIWEKRGEGEQEAKEKEEKIENR